MGSLYARHPGESCASVCSEIDSPVSRSSDADEAEAAYGRSVASALASDFPGLALLVGRAPQGANATGSKTLLRVEQGLADIASQRPVEPNTIFRIFSLTKPVVAASLLPLVADGRVALSDPIDKWIPEFEASRLCVWRGDGKTEPCVGSIRILDVLRHTNGMFYPASPNGTPGVQDGQLCALFNRAEVRSSRSPEEFAQRLASVPLYHQPGARFNYSPATALLARVAELTTGMPYDAYLREVLLEPLGMRDTGFFLQGEHQHERLANLYEQRDGLVQEASRKIFTYESGAPLNADGGLFSTLDDYARFVCFLASDGLGLVPKELLEVFMSDQLAPDALSVPESLGIGFPCSFGLGTYVHHDRLCGWSGLANTHFWLDLHSGRYAVLMAQRFPFSWKYQKLLTAHVRDASQTASQEHPDEDRA